jgi:polyferredoxin
VPLSLARDDRYHRKITMNIFSLSLSLPLLFFSLSQSGSAQSIAAVRTFSDYFSALATIFLLAAVSFFTAVLAAARLCRVLPPSAGFFFRTGPPSAAT